MTLQGELGVLTRGLARTIASDLELSGAFMVRSSGTRPASSLITWNSEGAFDYLGWWNAGAWLVIVGDVFPSRDGKIRVRLDSYLTEESDVLEIGDSEAVVSSNDVMGFAHRYLNAVLHCITGLSGSFGTRIAYSWRPRSGAPKEVHLVEFGSTDPVQVSHDGTVAMLPAWVPGGSIAYTGFRRGNPDVYIVDHPGLDDSGVRAFSMRQGMNSGVAFSPDGGLAAITLAPEGNPDVYLLDPRSGREIARLTSSRAIDTSPCWSPDGLSIAFVSDRAGGPGVWVMRADGLEKRPLSLPGYYNTSPDWSPDGREIAYQTRGPGGRFKIMAYDVDTGAVRRLTTGNGSYEEPSYSPDGRFIVFTASRRGSKALFVMSRDGSGVRALMEDDGEYFTPAWERPFTRRR